MRCAKSQSKRGTGTENNRDPTRVPNSAKAETVVENLSILLLKQESSVQLTCGGEPKRKALRFYHLQEAPFIYNIMGSVCEYSIVSV